MKVDCVLNIKVSDFVWAVKPLSPRASGQTFAAALSVVPLTGWTVNTLPPLVPQEHPSPSFTGAAVRVTGGFVCAWGVCWMLLSTCQESDISSFAKSANPTCNRISCDLHQKETEAENTPTFPNRSTRKETEQSITKPWRIQLNQSADISFLWTVSRLAVIIGDPLQKQQTVNCLTSLTHIHTCINSSRWKQRDVYSLKALYTPVECQGRKHVSRENLMSLEKCS